MRSVPLRKIAIGAGQYFGPEAGLGALGYSALGEFRRVLGDEIRFPIRIDAPFLWELQLSAETPLHDLPVYLASAPNAPTFARLFPGLKSEISGVVSPEPAGGAVALSFRLDLSPGMGPVHFLGLSFMALPRPALADAAQPK